MNIPEQLRNADVCIVNGKNPNVGGTNWHTKGLKYDNPIIQSWQGNLGIIANNGLIILDADSKEIIDIIQNVLPETFTVKTAKGLHAYFYIDGIEKAVRLSDPLQIEINNEGKQHFKKVGDIQAGGAMCVAPGSIHKTGIIYTVIKDLPIKTISKECLNDAVGHFHIKAQKNHSVFNILEDPEIEKIKQNIKLSDLMRKYGYDTSRNPTMCQLGHTSENEKCFSYDDKNGLWHCFNCGSGGDIFNFVMEHEHIDFKTAKQKTVNDYEQTQMSNAEKMFTTLWERTVIEQPIFRKMCWHNLLGTVLAEKDKDLRINILFEAFTTSGKDEGKQVVRSILEDLGNTTSCPDEITDAGLVGSFDNDAHTFNTKNSLDENNKEVMKGKTKLKYKNPKIQGILENTDWLAFTEAEQIFKPGQNNLKIQALLRRTADPERRIEKRLKNLKQDFYTNTSLLIASFPVGREFSKLLINGLAERLLCYKSVLNSNQSNKICKHLNNNYFSKDNNYENRQGQTFKDLITELKNIKSWYNQNKTEITFDTQIMAMMDAELEVLNKNDENLNKQILEALVRRGIPLIARLVKHNAIARQSIIIEPQDLNKALDLWKTCYNNVKRAVTTDMDNDSLIELKIVETLRQNGSLNKMQLYKKVKEGNSWGMNKIAGIVSELQRNSIILPQDAGREVPLNINPEV